MKPVIYALVITFLWTVICNAKSLLDSAYQYQKLKDHEKAIGFCERFVQVKSISEKQKSEAYFAMGFSYNKLGQPSNAIQSYLLSIDAYDHPKCLARAHYNIAYIYDTFSHYEQAIEHYNIALSLTDSPAKRGKYLVARAISYKYIGQYSEALNDVLEAQDIALTDIENNRRLLYNAYNQRGLIKVAAGDFGEAIEYFNYANDLGLHIKSYVNIGLTYTKAEEDQKAIEAFTNALAKKQNKDQRFKTYQALGELYVKFQNHEKAAQYLKMAEDQYDSLLYPDGDDIRLFSTFGTFYKHSGDSAKSIHYFEKSANLYMTLEEVKSELLINAKKMELENTEKQFYARQKAEQEKQTALIIGGVTFGVLLLIIITLVYVYKTRRNRVERMKEDARSGIRTVLNISDELVDTE